MRYLTLLALICFPIDVLARDCLKSSQAEQRLAERHGEYKVAAGIAQDGRLLEWYVSADNGSWSIVKVDRNGCAVIVDSGEAWLEIPAIVRGPEL